jgi:hypothetical protein
MSPTYSEGVQRTIREIREILLDLLDAAYPISIREADLTRGLADATMPRPIAAEKTLKDLAYLAGIGLAVQSVAAHPGSGEPVVRWTLTSKGKFFCERNKPWSKVETL